ncbi:tetratricopeptide repeat protein [Cupriavidus malaysiensis]|nr:tetratricopeptide repeat protein [Cupriavidus malaysiensis]
MKTWIQGMQRRWWTGLLPVALAGCSALANSNSAAMLEQQAQAQSELIKAQNKEARAEYNDKALYLALIEKMQQQDLYFASLAHIDAFQQRFGAGPEILALRAEALRETGQDAAATEAYQALARQGGAARAHHGLGLIAGRQGDFGKAVQELRQASAADPTNPRIASDLGYALMRTGALQEARVPVMQALQLDGSNLKVVGNAAVWLIADGKRGQATALMQKAALPEAARSAIRREAERIARASNTRERAAVVWPGASALARLAQPAPAAVAAGAAASADPGGSGQ